MADTDFGALTTEQKTVWSRKLWREAMAQTFVSKFMGKDHNAMIQHITELTRDERGDRAVLTLVAELVEDGTVGDYDLEGHEEGIAVYDKVITIDQLRHANRTKGRMMEQKSVVQFRRVSRSVLANWLSDRIDQMAFLTLSGVAYTQRNSGAARPVNAAGYNLGDLAFAADVTAPSARRHLRWVNASSSLAAGDTTAVVAADKLTYEALVRARAYCKTEYIRGIRAPNMPTGDVYHVFVTPDGMADLRLDEKYRQNVLYAAPRSKNSEVFTGAISVMADGMVIHEYHHVYNTKGAAAPNKWGAAGDVDGQRVLICGAQALGMGDLGLPQWIEEPFDYRNKMGIATGKILGFLKPTFQSSHSGTEEDFGVVVLDTAI